MLTGQNGILTKANEAKEETEEANKKENQDLETLEEDYLAQIDTKTTGRAGEISQNWEKYKGKEVSYNTGKPEFDSGEDKINWKIFYSDDIHIYLISSNCVNIQTQTPKTLRGNALNEGESKYCGYFQNIINDYSKDGEKNDIDNSKAKKWLTCKHSVNIQPVEYMMDTDIWTNLYGNNSESYWVIGGPTLDMFAASYNKSFERKLEYTSDGYINRI